MRYICDRMLGRLARWLRMMGVDAEYPGEMDDADLADMVTSRGRVLLTRDTELARTLGCGALHIGAHDLDGQARAFIEAFGMPEDWFSRCTLCNGVLSDDEPVGLGGRIPEGVLHRNSDLWACRHCGQVYWKGTQFDDIDARLRTLAGASSVNGGADDG